MNELSALLLLRASTPVHAGAGRTLGTIDLPVQREQHTGWPLLQSSTVRGALRDLHRQHLVSEGKARDLEAADAHAEVRSVFGAQNAEQAGALSVADARLLALPARSAAGVFAWVTCGAALERLAHDLELAGFAVPSPPANLPVLDWGEARGPAHAGALVATEHGGKRWALLETLALDLELESGNEPNSVSRWADWVAQSFFGVNPTEAPRSFFDPRRRLVVVADDAFELLTLLGTEVIPRVRLDEFKRVQSGAFWYVELLPSETLLYTVLADLESRPGGRGPRAIDTVCRFLAAARNRLQVGGEESIGKGWLEARTLRSLPGPSASEKAA